MLTERHFRLKNLSVQTAYTYKETTLSPVRPAGPWTVLCDNEAFLHTAASKRAMTTAGVPRVASASIFPRPQPGREDVGLATAQNSRQGL